MTRKCSPSIMGWTALTVFLSLHSNIIPEVLHCVPQSGPNPGCTHPTMWLGGSDRTKLTMSSSVYMTA